MRRLTKEQFVTVAKSVYGDRYDYDDVVYVTSKQKVSVRCNECDTRFNVTPNNHLNPSNYAGCTNCKRSVTAKPRNRSAVRTSTSLPFSEFVTRSTEVHGAEYQYHEDRYDKLTLKTLITHLGCGTSFWQRGTHHVAGQRCPTCFGRCFVSRGETAWLDSINVPVSQRNVWLTLSTGRRVNVDGRCFNTVYEFYGTKIHADPRVHEPDEWSDLHGCYMGEVYASTIEREEQIVADGYELVTMWELDWDARGGKS